MIIYFVRIGLYVRYIYVGYKRFDISINIFYGGGGWFWLNYSLDKS